MSKHIKNSGFIGPSGRSLGRERRTTVLAELAAITGLTISTIIAATVVSVGMARASAVDGVIDHEGSLFAVALVIGVIFIGLGGLTGLKPTKRHQH